MTCHATSGQAGELARPGFAKKALRLVLAVGLSGFVVGWQRPQLPTNAKLAAEAGARLDFLVVLVNGERRIVRAGDELVVIHGDRIEVVDATLADRSLRPAEVNVAGFHSPRAKRAGEDRGLPFTTADLQLRWSEGGRGEVYGIVVTSRDVLHGAVHLRLIDPVLRYAELSLNGKPLILRDGEGVEIAATDMVKVQKVVTNLFSTEGVTFQMVPATDADGAASGPRRFEIRFLRAGRPFAAIPLTVRGS